MKKPKAKSTTTRKPAPAPKKPVPTPKKPVKPAKPSPSRDSLDARKAITAANKKGLVTRTVKVGRAAGKSMRTDDRAPFFAPAPVKPRKTPAAARVAQPNPEPRNEEPVVEETFEPRLVPPLRADAIPPIPERKNKRWLDNQPRRRSSPLPPRRTEKQPVETYESQMAQAGALRAPGDQTLKGKTEEEAEDDSE